MMPLRHYFDGTNGVAIEGDVPVSMLVSSDKRPDAVETMYFRYSDRFLINPHARTTTSLQ